MTRPNPLALTLAFPHEWMSGVALLNAGIFTLCVIAALFLIARQANRLLRPAFMIAALIMLFYQFPLVLYTPLLVKHLPNIYWYMLTIHAVVISLLLWVWSSAALTVPNLYAAQRRQAGFSAIHLTITLGLLLLFASIYLSVVPLECTALSAMYNEPNISLLARELSIKLVGTSIATYAFGMIVNTLAPIVGFLSLWQSYRAWQTKRWLQIPLWLLAMTIAMTITLLSGAKGNLIPSFVTMLVAGFLLARRWRWRMVNSIAILGLLVTFLIGYQMIGQRETWPGKYPFGYCAKVIGACERTRSLLDSLRLRELSLGLDQWRINELEQDLNRVCYPYTCHYGRFNYTRGIYAEAMQNKAKGEKPGAFVPSPEMLQAARSGEKSEPVPLPAPLPAVQNRLSDHVYGLFYRILGTPFQVSVWHFLYVAEHGQPGKLAHPLAAKLYGDSINMPERVYQAYGSIFSGGDRTSTSTAPTSYLFSYAAYWGAGGLMVALLLTFLIDIAFSLVIRIADSPVRHLAIGLATVTALNILISDMLVILLTHGAAASILLLLAFAALYHIDFTRFKR